MKNKMKKGIIPASILVALAGILASLVILLPKLQVAPESQTLGGGFAAQDCTASTTAWTVGLAAQDGSKTILPVNARRAFFILQNRDTTDDVYFRLDSTAPVTGNALVIQPEGSLEKAEFIFDETFGYRGVVTAAAAATSTLIVTECLYPN